MPSTYCGHCDSFFFQIYEKVVSIRDFKCAPYSQIPKGFYSGEEHPLSDVSAGAGLREGAVHSTLLLY